MCWVNISIYLDVKRWFMYQNQPSKLHQLPFDQRVKIFIPPRSPASAPESIGTPYDDILHQSELPGFVVGLTPLWLTLLRSS
jgi:hypothetical protein